MHPELQTRRQDLLDQIASIDRLRQGQLSEQYYDRVLRNGEVRQQGPYYVLQRQRECKKASVRIPTDQVEQVRQDVGNYQRYKQLTQELADLTEKLTLASDQPDSKKKPRRSTGRTLRRWKHS